MKIDLTLTPGRLRPAIETVFRLSGKKILSLEKTWEPARGTPVFTVGGRYATRGWTEWTQGFQYGAALLQFDATDEAEFLELGRRQTIARMAPHVSHVGVHDHGFNNVSTYGNLLRLMREGRIPANEREEQFYELALKVSGAVQAARWTSLAAGGGYIYSFNGPHSLFIDTLRSLRSLALAHQLGHVLMGERDQPILLWPRLLEHAATTARHAVYYGENRDAYDVRGRVAHESIFNLNDGHYRCPNSQQGYSPFSTWTRGLAWAVLGFAEELEFFRDVVQGSVRGGEGTKATQPTETTGTAAPGGPPRAEAKGRTLSVRLDRITAAYLDDVLQHLTSSPATLAEADPALAAMLKGALATADFYLANACADGVPMWDTGAPNLHRLGDYLTKPADPFNAWEPVDSSAAAIAAQGLIRLGRFLGAKPGRRYVQAGLTIARTLFQEPYLSTKENHQGLLLHSVYHRPNGWDHIVRGQKVPNGESSMWGDYHLRELALLLLREANQGPYLTFYPRSVSSTKPAHDETV